MTAANPRLDEENTTAFSFEFFPPKSAKAIAQLDKTSKVLAKLDPAFFSCTFGAGGSTQRGTYDAVTRLKAETGISSAPHLSCIGQTKDSVAELLEEYRAAGVKRIVALRGDIPSGMVDLGDFDHANELVAFIRETTAEHFHIEVAAYPEYHPQAENPQQDLDNFVRKCQAGANSAITQYFYNADAYFDFVERAEQAGVTLPIVPGIMPITNYTQLTRFSDACGTEIPRWIRQRLRAYGDDLDSLRDFGCDVVSHLATTLLDNGAPGLHFYTLNRALPVLRIWQNIGLPNSERITL